MRFDKALWFTSFVIAFNTGLGFWGLNWFSLIQFSLAAWLIYREYVRQMMWKRIDRHNEATNRMLRNLRPGQNVVYERTVAGLLIVGVSQIDDSFGTLQPIVNWGRDGF
tara:strand:- start:1865 stop:2191 length:327 start_codon:yes stop_codon:yes gene_type:complete